MNPKSVFSIFGDDDTIYFKEHYKIGKWQAVLKLSAAFALNVFKFRKKIFPSNIFIM